VGIFCYLNEKRYICLNSRNNLNRRKSNGVQKNISANVNISIAIFDKPQCIPEYLFIVAEFSERENQHAWRHGFRLQCRFLFWDSL